MTDTADWGSYYQSPTELATIGLDYIEKAAGRMGVTSHVTALREVLLPHVPGRYLLVIGNQGGGKTFFMSGWTRYVSNEIIRREKAGLSNGRECVVYVSLEDPLETHAIRRYAQALNVPISDIYSGVVTAEQAKGVWSVVQSGRVYHIGVSMGARRGELYGLTSNDVYQIVFDMTGRQRLKPRAVFIDYMTAFARRPDQRTSRLEQYAEDAATMVRLSVDLDVPVIVAAQARRDRQHDITGNPIPQPGDVEHAFAFVQRATTILSLGHPIDSVAAGGQNMPSVTVGGQQVVVTPRLLLMGVTKQNSGQSNFTTAGLMNFATGGIDQYEPPY